MIRRALLSALPALLAAPALHAQTSRGPGPAQAADLRRIENYFNTLTTLKARFLQLAQNGASAQGTAWIWRPGRMRFDYDPPEPLLLVASNGQFLHYDRELGQPSVVPVGSTPLGFLLRPNLQLSGDVTVTGQERSGGFLRVTLFRTDNAAEGRLTLVLAEEPTELRQWVVTDAQGRNTRVTLSQIETGGQFDRSLFEFNDPRFQELEMQRRR
ncbi:LolA family protein [Roseomonas sp. BN140053]|uniref:LolA family protein n=1 Tax=Roseomonas sp. BN140053 TaxID=3391898 RepID=UPI0039E81E7D